MYRIPHLPWYLAVLFVVGALASCSRSEETPQASKEATDAAAGKLVLRGAGATFPEPLYQRWFEEYEKTDPNVDITYEGVGSGAGIERFIAESVDFGASDSAMSDSEIAEVSRGVQLVPMTAGMLVLAYNIPKLEGKLKLPRDVYVDIFLGKITRWDDPRIAAVNPGVDLPAGWIQVVARRDSSGTTFAMTNHLAVISPEWRDGPGVGKQIDWPGNTVTGNGNAGVAQKIKITYNSIGYVNYEFAKRLGLPMAMLENQAGQYVSPSASSGEAALAATAVEFPDHLRHYIPDPAGEGAYPIVTYSWLLVYREYADAAKASALKDAIAWGLANVQPIAEELGYVPLPEDVIALSEAALLKVH